MTRTRIAVIALAAALTLSGCGGAPQAAPSGPAGTQALGDVDAELVALETVGLADAADGGDKQRPRPRLIRKHLRTNTLHGEVAVQGKDGVRTVVVQRGTITEVSDAGITVESTDGFDLTWTYGDQLRLVQDRQAVERSVLRTGVQVGVGGVREGEITKARLIVVK
jgi:hypothetical protein